MEGFHFFGRIVFSSMSLDTELSFMRTHRPIFTISSFSFLRIHARIVEGFTASNAAASETVSRRGGDES
jgi:hypothetical protein